MGRETQRLGSRSVSLRPYVPQLGQRQAIALMPRLYRVVAEHIGLIGRDQGIERTIIGQSRSGQAEQCNNHQQQTHGHSGINIQS